MQRFLFARMEVWIVVLLALIALLGAIGFGTAVLDGERGEGRFGGVGRAALTVAEAPNIAVKIFEPDLSLTYAGAARFDALPAGWSFPAGSLPAGIGGYMLTSRFDGTRQRHVVALMSLADLSVLHEWLPVADTLLAGLPRVSPIADYTSWRMGRFRAIHPLAEPNGDLIIKDHYGPLFRIDACSRKVWAQAEMMFSHSTESDGAGGFWVVGHPNAPFDARFPARFYDDSITHISADGKILQSRSLVELFAQTDMKALIYRTGPVDTDPVHLNDIQPVLADGPYWKKGDLLLSTRRYSMLLLYRPSSDEIIWKKAGPWLGPHDIDILDDHRISVFNNNAFNYGNGPHVDGVSAPMIYDFASDTVTSPLRDAMVENEVKTFSEGLVEYLPGGYSFVEEENAGRYLILSPQGAVVAQFVNRAEDGRIYRLGWSRFVNQKDGDALLGVLQQAQCP